MATDEKNILIPDQANWTDKKGNEQTEPEYFVYRSKNSVKNSNLKDNDWNDPEKLFDQGLHSGDHYEEKLYEQLTNPEKEGQNQTPISSMTVEDSGE